MPGTAFDSAFSAITSDPPKEYLIYVGRHYTMRKQKKFRFINNGRELVQTLAIPPR